MSDTPADRSGVNFVIVDELKKMEKRLMTFIEAMIRPTLRATSSIPVEARNSWQEDEPSAFSMNILSDQRPPNFIEPLFDNYTGRTDPFYHIAQFESAVSLKNLTGSQKCLLLRTTLKETSLQWFSNLPVGSITNYADFKKQLLACFVSAKKRLREPETLFNVIQEHTESLQSYVDRFIQATVNISNFDPTTAKLTLTHGLRDEIFRYFLRITPPESYDNLLDMLNCYINMRADSMEEEKHLAHCDTPREEIWSSQKAYTIYVKGFDNSLSLDEIERSLEEHFGLCGAIRKVELPEKFPGVSKGFGFIDFVDFNAFSMALQLDDSVLGGFILTVREAFPRRPNKSRLLY